MLQALQPIIAALAEHEPCSSKQLQDMNEDALHLEEAYWHALFSLAILAQEIDKDQLEYWENIQSYASGQCAAVDLARMKQGRSADTRNLSE